MTHQEIIDRWNTQADRFNQWRELSEEEKLEWAMSLEREECAKVASERQHWPMPRFTHAPSERTMGRIDGEKEMSRQIAAAIRARGNK